MSDGGDLEHAERIIRGIIKKYVGVDELARIIAAAEKRGRLAGLKEARSRAIHAGDAIAASIRARSETKLSGDHETIWLDCPHNDQGDQGRMWAEDNPFAPCEIPGCAGPVEFIRMDLHQTAIAAVIGAMLDNGGGAA